MDVQGLRETLQRQPFEPLAIRLADGRGLPVRHLDFVSVGNRRVVVGDNKSQRRRKS